MSNMPDILSAPASVLKKLVDAYSDDPQEYLVTKSSHWTIRYAVIVGSKLLSSCFYGAIASAIMYSLRCKQDTLASSAARRTNGGMAKLQRAGFVSPRQLLARKGSYFLNLCRAKCLPSRSTDSINSDETTKSKSTSCSAAVRRPTSRKDTSETSCSHVTTARSCKRSVSTLYCASFVKENRLSDTSDTSDNRSGCATNHTQPFNGTTFEASLSDTRHCQQSDTAIINLSSNNSDHPQPSTNADVLWHGNRWESNNGTQSSTESQLCGTTYYSYSSKDEKGFRICEQHRNGFGDSKRQRVCNRTSKDTLVKRLQRQPTITRSQVSPNRRRRAYSHR